MNEKIKELLDKAEVYYNDDMYSDLNDLASLQKFAELIIEECIEQVKPTQHHEVWAQSYLGGVDGLDLLYSKVKEIKKHFGVEE
jgi:hypothetical protein